MMLASLNLLAIAWHTVLELREPPWIAARAAAAKRSSFFADLAISPPTPSFPRGPSSPKSSPTSQSPRADENPNNLMAPAQNAYF